MTDNPYLARVTSQHRKPMFLGVVDAATAPLVELGYIYEALRRAFDLDTAIGLQLDAVGEWVGRPRNLTVPLTGVYFAWDEAGVGWEEGTWRGPYDPETGLLTLPDDSYRLLLRAKVAANRWDGTRDGAYDIWEAVFAGQGMIVMILDGQDMTIQIAIAGNPPGAVFEQLLVGGHIPLKPEGVRIDSYAMPAIPGPLFAWDCDTSGLAGWDDGGWPKIFMTEGA